MRGPRAGVSRARPLRLICLAALAALFVVACATDLLGPLQEGALCLAPALALVALLAVGHYPGERTLARLRCARTRRVARDALRPLRPRRIPGARMRRAPLIAVSLAGRAPPPAPALA